MVDTDAADVNDGGLPLASSAANAPAGSASDDRDDIRWRRRRIDERRRPYAAYCYRHQHEQRTLGAVRRSPHLHWYLLYIPIFITIKSFAVFRVLRPYRPTY